MYQCGRHALASEYSSPGQITFYTLRMNPSNLGSDSLISVSCYRKVSQSDSPLSKNLESFTPSLLPNMIGLSPRRGISFGYPCKRGPLMNLSTSNLFLLFCFQIRSSESRSSTREKNLSISSLSLSIQKYQEKIQGSYLFKICSAQSLRQLFQLDYALSFAKLSVFVKESVASQPVAYLIEVLVTYRSH